jgi:hypothetical protein
VLWNLIVAKFMKRFFTLMKSQFLAVFTRTPFPNALKLHLQESFGNRTIEF